MIRRAIALLLCVWFSLILNARAYAAGEAKKKAAQSAASLGLAVGDARAVVLYFIASDCPISNRQLPEMLRIEHEFVGRGVHFWFVYPNSTETLQTMQRHRTAFGLERNMRADPHSLLANFTGANVTPETAILVPVGGALRTVYIGRVDDRYLSIGTERPMATRHDLEDAITAVLAARPVPQPGGPPVGCAFMSLPAK